MERRSGPRLALDANAIIRVDRLDADVQSRIVNASESGLLLAAPEGRPVGTRIRITVQIDDPKHDITVSGIIVHAGSSPEVDPAYRTRLGIFLTEHGPDWSALCRRLARLPRE